MLRKVGATLIVVGVFLPFNALSTHPIEFVFQGADAWGSFVLWGIPVLFLILFAATAMVGRVREFVTRHWRVIYPVSALWYVGLVILLCVLVAMDIAFEWEMLLALVLAIGLTLPLFLWAWQRHGAAERVPFTLLLAGGLIWLFFFVGVFTDLDYGAYVLLTGLVVCTVTEVQELRRAAPDGEP